MIRKGDLVKAVHSKRTRTEKLMAFGLEPGDVGIVVESKTIRPILEPQHEVYWCKIQRKVWFSNDELECLKSE